ncbi:ribosomal protein S18-alanine N-acetyltransferase [Mycoplasmatota bacterium WC30]
MDIIIRDMHISDINKIAKYDLIMLGETMGEETIREHIENNNLMKYLVMETEDKKFIGQMSLWIDEDKAQINNFYIIKGYQKQKLGRKFLEYVLKYFETIGIDEITLEVKKSNEIAIKLYESYGFKQVSIRKNYYPNGEDAYLMYLRIGSD